MYLVARGQVRAFTFIVMLSVVPNLEILVVSLESIRFLFWGGRLGNEHGKRYKSSQGLSLFASKITYLLRISALKLQE